MRLGVIADRLVLIDGETAVDLEQASKGRFPADPAQLFDRWEALVDWAATAELDGEKLPLTGLQNPVPAPRQVFGIGANYRDHLAEASGRTMEELEEFLPKDPLIFTKFRNSLAGPADAIPLPSRDVDWEVELVVVMGRPAERVSEEDAWSHVAGLTVGQDISERVLQMAGPAPQFSMGKSFPAFGPMGPVLVTPDSLDDPDDLELGCTLNGRVMQKSRTSDLIFSVAELIAYISTVCPLLPGDVIFTGTPAGVGAFRKPPVFLKPGDTLVSWVKGIGELHNPVIAGHSYTDEGTNS
ncbi:MAG: fumarylacetoacetate hydrolase [Amycolatopsis sp.]|jgi:2,4-diketo-3-deoxy-L-fuconate hydrolase|uniref:fumarylacetoacetate hydrolase family protein n=1 Tax=Amycolatopsis sp. TaxID=37632 RepID=UPI00262173BC|nr:fumarylacetoacetate hydrolase family protein [Amycolatopsis sp.]MCU1682586.1 fumarylacetoacetate hydrolase [Amycolatopsis sp.]